MRVLNDAVCSVIGRDFGEPVAAEKPMGRHLFDVANGEYDDSRDVAVQMDLRPVQSLSPKVSKLIKKCTILLKNSRRTCLNKK